MADIFENQFSYKIHLLIIDFLVQGIYVGLLNSIFLFTKKQDQISFAYAKEEMN